jgi:hypothetical protein
MKPLRPSPVVLAALMVCAGRAENGDAATSPVPQTTDSLASAVNSVETRAWSFSISAFAYILPDEDDYIQSTATADRDRLHLEARYNYEALEAASVWAGYNMSGGEEWEWELTPMIGGVFGEATGIAPGYKASLGWRKLGLYSEGEYMFDTGDSSESFFYSWSEVAFAPAEWWYVGVVMQRTHVQSDREVQRGPFVGFSYRNVDVATYVFDPDDRKPTVVPAVTVSW